MTLLQPSFRGRLRLFFAVIVVVPMIAVGVALFFLLHAGDNSRFNSQLGEAQTVAQNLFQDGRANAMAAARTLQSDTELATAIDKGDEAAVRRRLEVLGREVGAERIVLQVTGMDTIEIGSPLAIAASQALLQNSAHTTIDRILISVTSASAYVDDTRR